MATAQYDSCYYQTNYRSYARQNPPRKLAFYARMVEQQLPPGLPRRIHDVGCAFGRFLGSLDERWEICGSDVSAYAIDQAARAYPRGSFQVGDASRALLFPEPFGVVTAFDVIEHIPDLDTFAASVNLQLLDGGSFIFVVPVYDGLSGPIIRFLDRDPTHVHKWPRQRWLDWAASHFEVRDWLGIVRYLLPTYQYLHLVTRRFRRHTPAILVACRKRAQ